MQKQRLALIAAGLLVAAIAASPAQAIPAVDYDISVDAKDKLTIEVINNYALDVRVFVVTENGESQEIGTVRRLNTKSLSVPSSILEDAGKIRIKVVTLAATAPHTHVQRALDGVKTAPFDVADGETIRLVVQEGLTLSVLGDG